MVPPIISLVAREIFVIGITAVFKLRFIPGIIPTTAGSITRKVTGVMIVCASLYDLAYVVIRVSIAAKKIVSGNNIESIIRIFSGRIKLIIVCITSGGSELVKL